MPRIVRTYEDVNNIPVGPRHPYAGELVFAAFSGSHQDAIAKGLRFRKEHDTPYWTVPYLPLDPSDVNREYETDVIRVNSQSGKGGIAYILEHHFGYLLPKEFQQEVGYFIKNISDQSHKELAPQEILDAFSACYINIVEPIALRGIDWRYEGEHTIAMLKLQFNGEMHSLVGKGNGSLDAVRSALGALQSLPKFHFDNYVQHALESESSARAATYVKISDHNGVPFWGVGIHNDITRASVSALLSAVNRYLTKE
jgi:2-isopropylmalate synthase